MATMTQAARKRFGRVATSLMRWHGVDSQGELRALLKEQGAPSGRLPSTQSISYYLQNSTPEWFVVDLLAVLPLTESQKLDLINAYLEDNHELAALFSELSELRND